MRDQDLNRLLQAAKVPERAPDFWAQFPKDVLDQLDRPEPVPTPVRPAFAVRQWAWGLGLAAACIALGFFLGYWRGRDAQSPAAQYAALQKYFKEVEGLFPNQLQALVIDENGPRLVLSEKPDVPRSRPLYLVVQTPAGQKSFVTFSGQKIRVNGEECEVLESAEGHVLVAGRHFFWSSAETRPAVGSIQVKALPQTL